MAWWAGWGGAKGAGRAVGRVWAWIAGTPWIWAVVTGRTERFIGASLWARVHARTFVRAGQISWAIFFQTSRVWRRAHRRHWHVGGRAKDTGRALGVVVVPPT